SELDPVALQPDPGVPARRRAAVPVPRLGANRLPQGRCLCLVYRVRRRGRLPDRLDHLERGPVHGAGPVHALCGVDAVALAGFGGGALRVRLLGRLHESGKGRRTTPEAEESGLVHPLAAGPPGPQAGPRGGTAPAGRGPNGPTARKDRPAREELADRRGTPLPGASQRPQAEPVVTWAGIGDVGYRNDPGPRFTRGLPDSRHPRYPIPDCSESPCRT